MHSIFHWLSCIINLCSVLWSHTANTHFTIIFSCFSINVLYSGHNKSCFLNVKNNFWVLRCWSCQILSSDELRDSWCILYAWVAYEGRGPCVIDLSDGEECSKLVCKHIIAAYACIHYDLQYIKMEQTIPNAAIAKIPHHLDTKFAQQYAIHLPCPHTHTHTHRHTHTHTHTHLLLVTWIQFRMANIITQ